MIKFVCSSVKNGESFNQIVEGVSNQDAEAYFRNVNEIKWSTAVYVAPLEMRVS